MPEWAVVIVAVVGAVGGMSGIAAMYSAWRTTGATAKKTEVEALKIVIDGVQDENARLQVRIDRLTTVVHRYRDGIQLLLQQLRGRGIEPAWNPDDDIIWDD